MDHTLNLQTIPFNQIKEGLKIVEVRLYDKKRKLLSVNDTIIFTKYPNYEEELTVSITNLTIYNSFKDLLKIVSLSDLGYDNNFTPENYLRMISKFYPTTLEQKYGVLAITFKTLT